MLEVSEVHSGYGPIKVLYGVSLAVGAGEILCVMGRNGAGKTTLLKTIMGLVPISSGTISLEGETLNKLPAHEIPKRGVGYIPQGRRLFPQLTVDENIQIGLAAGKKNGDVRKRIFSLFPALKERLHQQADTLSGGEQQMLATARALALAPKILLLDEPTEGLQPSMIEHIRHLVMKMRDDGFAIILVEQRIDAALSLADRVTIIENGKSVASLSAAEFGQSPDLVKRHLGV